MPNFKTGPLNTIADVDGITVGHTTIDDNDYQTGVTVIMPSTSNPFLYKLPAASCVINGFGKTAGLVQIDELGTLESPIALTNTLCVGRVHDALVSYMINQCAKDDYTLESINVVIGECNDAKINKIYEQKIEKSDVLNAINSAGKTFEQGAVGAGRGMVCHGLKGGIGSASKIIELEDFSYTLGALVLANHGKIEQLTIKGEPIGRALKEELSQDQPIEKGSIIVVLATDAPLDARQLKRLSKRATAGIARVGSEFGNGSGDIVIAFSTTNAVPHLKKDRKNKHSILSECLYDDALDDLFSAAVAATEDSILNALKYAKPIKNYHALSEFYKSL